MVSAFMASLVKAPESTIQCVFLNLFDMKEYFLSTKIFKCAWILLLNLSWIKKKEVGI